MKSFGILAIAFFALYYPRECHSARRAVLNNMGKYIFQNIGDSGFLTAIGTSESIVTDLWRNSPGQIWQVSKGFLYASYLLKPFSGAGAKSSMSITSTKNGATIVKKLPYTFGMSSSLYWSALPVKDNIYVLQNLDNEQCLESNGMGQPVSVSPCKVDSKIQQWAIHPQ